MTFQRLLPFAAVADPLVVFRERVFLVYGGDLKRVLLHTGYSWKTADFFSAT